MNEQWRNTELWLKKTEEGEFFSLQGSHSIQDRIVGTIGLLIAIVFCFYWLCWGFYSLVNAASINILFLLLWLGLLGFTFFLFTLPFKTGGILSPSPYVHLKAQQLTCFNASIQQQINIQDIERIEITYNEAYYLIIHGPHQSFSLPFKLTTETAELFRAYILNPTTISTKATAPIDKTPYTTHRNNSTNPELTLSISSNDFRSKDALPSVIIYYIFIAAPFLIGIYMLSFWEGGFVTPIFWIGSLLLLKNTTGNNVFHIKYRINKQTIQRYRLPIPFFKQFNVKTKDIAQIYIAPYQHFHRIYIANFNGAIHTIPIDFLNQTQAEELKEKINEIFNYIPPAERLNSNQ